jgi:hypothetical protein
MGLREDDGYKRLKLKQDVDAIIGDCGDLIALHGLDMTNVRMAVEAMLKDQPLPLAGSR